MRQGAGRIDRRKRRRARLQALNRDLPDDQASALACGLEAPSAVNDPRAIGCGDTAVGHSGWSTAYLPSAPIDNSENGHTVALGKRAEGDDARLSLYARWTPLPSGNIASEKSGTCVTSVLSPRCWPRELGKRRDIVCLL